MYNRLLRHLQLVLALLAFGVLTARGATAQEVWFSPWSASSGPKDYMALFQPNSPWQRAAAHVKVFEISGHTILGQPQTDFIAEMDLRNMFSDLKRRHINLEIGIEPLTAPGQRGPTNCAYHVEGYGGPQPLAVAKRAKALGADAEFFGMDEPLYFGHAFGSPDGKHGCHASIAEIARDVANTVHQVRSVYPGVKFGDVEPMSFADNDPWFKNGVWLADLSTWFDSYEAATGEKLAFFRIDAWWTKRFAENMPALARLLRAKGIPLQIIYNGNGQDKTDSAWIASAVSHFKQFESGNWPLPDAAVIEFWTPNPSRVLPETDPLTATGLIDQYLDWQETRSRQ